MVFTSIGKKVMITTTAAFDGQSKPNHITMMGAMPTIGSALTRLPTGAQAGLGARLLSGSYYGQTVQIWAALIVAAVLAGLCVGAVGLAERVTLYRMGGRA